MNDDGARGPGFFSDFRVPSEVRFFPGSQPRGEYCQRAEDTYPDQRYYRPGSEEFETEVRQAQAGENNEGRGGCRYPEEYGPPSFVE